jgi:hypothetical protein
MPTPHEAPGSMFDRGEPDRPKGPAADRLAEFVECLTGIDADDNVRSLRAQQEDGTVREPLQLVAHSMIDLRDHGRRGMGAPRYLEPDRQFEPVIDLTLPEHVVDDRFRQKNRSVGVTPRRVSDRPTGRTSPGFVPA